MRAEVGDEALLVCGTGTNDTHHSRELTKMAAEAGADASLVVAPYYNKPNRAGIRAHFEAVAAAVPELPMVMYNIPSRVIVNADPELLGELAQIDNIVAVKQANDEELGPIEGLAVLAGNDNTFLRVARVRRRRRHPRRLPRRRRPDARDVGRGPGRGHRAGAARSTPSCSRSTPALSVTTNPIPVKAALEMLGLASDRVRLPLVAADAEQRAAVRAALEGVGLPWPAEHNS